MIAVTCVAVLVAMLADRLLRPAGGRPLGRSGSRCRHIDRTAELIAFLDVASREMRSGTSLPAARRRAADAHPTAAEVGRAADADRAVVAQALAAATMGGPSAAALDRAAAVLRERQAVRNERLAHAAMARLSARVLTVVPLVFAAWAATSSASTRRAYLDSPWGFGAAAAGIVLNVGGWCWMRRVVARHG